jgi:hypothetical protein
VSIVIVIISNICVVWSVKQEVHEKNQKSINLERVFLVQSQSAGLPVILTGKPVLPADLPFLLVFVVIEFKI